MTLWTIGHSTLGIEAFLSRLSAHGIRALADVRLFPASRRHPHFGAQPLAGALRAQQIDYRPFPELGGRRRARPDSRNTAWRHAAFRGYADYMETEPFRSAIARLLETAAEQRTVVMCAERLWWRCHRALIADDLKAAGHDVLHIGATEKLQPHPFTSAARLVDGTLSYEEPRLF